MTWEPRATISDSSRLDAGARAGVLPSQQLLAAVQAGWISSGDYRIRPESVQPASIDLRLADHAWPLRCSFLPSAGTAVMDRVADLALDRIDLRDGATLERDRPYLIPLLEELALPEHVRAKANPKSSTGRLDVFTRVITDGNHRFDEVPAGHRGRLYLEVVPRSFAVRVQERLSLNQLRLATGDARLDDADLRAVHEEQPLLYVDQEPLRGGDLSISDGLFL
ncbi:MAG: 2'-deoxycytidine 5'-triphosphate deaminase domain-containing protein, partial [Solirubrobacteraceae bacterium]